MKTILITGSTDGIGKHLAKKLASEGHQVILHGRNAKKMETALKEVKEVSSSGKVSAYLADFSKMSDVFKLTEEIKRDFTKIDVLLNNAGLYAGSSRKSTDENIEFTFMLSVMVPYILTKELQELLAKSEDARVINTSSFMHHFAKVKELDFGFEKKYTPGLAYNNSKLYTIWLTRYQARYFSNKGSRISVNAYHPGLISTNLGNETSDPKVKNSIFGRFMKAVSKNLDQGIETGYYLSLSDQVTGVTGQYFDNKKTKYVSEKGYSPEKSRELIRYCEKKIEEYKGVFH